MRPLDGLDLLLAVIIIVLLLFPRPWFRPRARPRPSCYADWPHYNYQDQAERDCHNCLSAHECFEDTPYNPRVPPPRPAGSPPPARPTR